MIIHQTPNDSAARLALGRIRSNIPALIYVLVVLTLIALPVRILDFGYLPPDDALRHAAKAVSGKSWQEILVMRPEITMDHNPGWNWILTSLHRTAGWDPKRLVAFSVVAMFLLVGGSTLCWMRRPEAWLISLAAMMLIFPYFGARAFVGRPLFVTMAVSLILLCLWSRPGLLRRSRHARQSTLPDSSGTLSHSLGEGRGEGQLTPSSVSTVSRKLLLVSAALIALSVWIHGSWYLLACLPIVLCLAQEWRKAALLALCWAGGCVAGALLTGEPWKFLKEGTLIPILALGQAAPLDSLVGEFQPLPIASGYPALALVAVVMIWRKLARRAGTPLWRDPVFWMAAAGLALGFRVLRFWLDWGIPALALWLAREIQNPLESWMPKNSWSRVALTCAVALVLVAAVANDRGGRWSQSGAFECLDAARPEQAGWVPDPGGILYCVDLSVFYQTFFTNPQGDWRYILGFEPSFMRPEDLAVYQDLWQSGNAIKACAPWVKRMTAADRLVLHGGPRPRPAIPELQWNYVAKNTWVGRLSRQEEKPSASSHEAL